MKKTFYLYSDLETTTINTNGLSYKEYFKKESYDAPQIYSWGILYTGEYDKLVDDNENWHYEFDKKRNIHIHLGISGESYIKFISQLKVDVKIYFNNSKGFDSHYIIGVLNDLNYSPILPFDEKEYKKIYGNDFLDNYQIWKKGRVNYIYSQLQKSKTFSNLSLDEKKKLVLKNWNYRWKNEYSELANDNTQILKLTISTNHQYWSKNVKKFRQVQIIDNLSIFGTSIEKMGETISHYYINKKGWEKDLAEKEFHKKEISYLRTNLYKNFQEFFNDGNEKDYLIQDIYILYEYHNLIETYLSRNKWKLTSASTSYNEWLVSFIDSYLPKLLKTGKVKKVDVKNGGYKYSYNKRLFTTSSLGKYILDDILPTRWLDKQDNNDYVNNHTDIYRWYSGGLTQVNEKYRGQVVENISVVDINSSYPNQMNLDIDVPVGIGHRGDRKDYKFKLYEMNITDTIINKKGIPFLFSVYDEKRNYRKVLKSGMKIYLNTYEYEKFLKYYQPKKNSYKLKVIWCFKTIKMNSLFGGYIDKWFSEKIKSSKDKNKVIVAICKLFLNSLYGKFGTKSERVSRVWNPFKNVWEKKTEIVKSKYYLPIAIAITSLARMQLVEMADERFDDVVYMDTDSLFIVDFISDNFKNIKLDKFKLGYCDVEFEKGIGLVRRAKQYFFINPDKKRKVAFAGINFNRDITDELNEDELRKAKSILETLTLKDFVNGREIENQLSPYRVVGKGIVLETGIKNIKPIWDYKSLPEQIYKDEKDFKKVLKSIDNLNIVY